MGDVGGRGRVGEKAFIDLGKGREGGGGEGGRERGGREGEREGGGRERERGEGGRE